MSHCEAALASFPESRFVDGSTKVGHQQIECCDTVKHNNRSRVSVYVCLPVGVDCIDVCSVAGAGGRQRQRVVVVTAGAVEGPQV